MGYFKRSAQEAANLTEKSHKKARLLEEPRFAEYPSSALRLSGDGDLPPLNRVSHRGDSPCWTILPLGFSKYGGGSFPELVVCNACASTESKLAHAEFLTMCSLNVDNVPLLFCRATCGTTSRSSGYL
jgi:hypothetical protein